MKEFIDSRYDTIKLSHTHGAAYGQAIEELVSEILSDFRSCAALRFEKALRQAQLKKSTNAQAKPGWGGASSTAQSSYGEKTSRCCKNNN